MNEEQHHIGPNEPLPKPPLSKRFSLWRQRYVRPVWCVIIAARLIASVIDFEDVVYIASIAMVAIGAERALGSGFGLMCAGMLLLSPMAVRVMTIRRGPSK